MGRISQKSKEIKELNLNIFPLMNLFVILIPFLLTSAAFYHMALVNANILTNNPEGTKLPPPSILPLDIYLNIKKDGFILSSSRPMLEGEKDISFPNLPGGEYDYTGLSNKLHQVKQANMDTTTIYLTTDSEIPYDTVIKTIDHCREIKTGSGLMDIFEMFPKISITRN